MRFTAFMLILGFSLSQGWAQGIQFFEGSWAEALEQAKKEEKAIFVDAYATWCGPCKRMARDVFPDPKVGAFYNKHFISVKLDMERGEGLEFRKTYPVSAFPTLFFINGDGEVVQKVRGAQDVNGFLSLGQKVLGLADRSEDYAAEYEKGNREPELVYKYVKALNNAGKPSLRIANEYLNSQKDLRTDFNLRFILEAATEADSKIFGLLIDNRSRIEALEGKEAVQQRIQDACLATMQKAVEFQSPELLKEAQDKMKQHYPEVAEGFELSSQMQFAQAMGDGKTYAKTSKKYAQKVLNGQPEELAKLANELVKNFGSEPDAMKQAEAFAEEAAKNGNKYQYYLTYSQILYLSGKAKEGRAAADKALQLARTEGPQAVMAAESFIKKMEGKGW